ncbi:DNA ligase [Shewanella eurypsychrophilus]|uniref:DNA ligase n=1 Tax=Shewanella eurypsychrophilus TaxID=2593656 RepID=A0ABX6VF96_9GAMM|nr:MULTISPECIES: BRCT domain-containing protein [Shewanella]QFU25348.1 DNA ligase [Shewanella sp. YLB-09]QPG60489.1 DNA ligase [Shewanella eurypsychrophilus]
MSEFIFNEQHRSIIHKLELNIELHIIEKAINEQKFDSLSNDSLVGLLKIANALYRSGTPIIKDTQYDLLLKDFSIKQPEHPYLNSVEPEILAESKTVALPQKMLSTDKAYSFEEIKKWIDRLLKAAKEVQIDPDEVMIRVTPKLDGYAAFDDGETLYTRGDGVRGQDITRAITRGLRVANDGKRGLGAGEIVISKNYFDEKLTHLFENSRNIQAGIIAEKKVDENIQQAINEGACLFYPFRLLENRTEHYSKILSDFESIVDEIWNSVDFDIDGIILEVTNEAIKDHMGATRKFHRWQIAFKVNNDGVEVEVLDVIPQTSRTGRVTPVAKLVPTKLSGATISRVTVHHYNMVKTSGIGPGAVIQLVRSGLVIPKIEKVIKKVEPKLAELCPSCESRLLWESDNLICPNKTDCPAQTENTLIHFFKTLGNNDGFGPKVIERLASFGKKHIHEIYAIEAHHFSTFKFGDKTSKNLFDQLRVSREVEIEDWRFLSAFGVSRLGAGNCDKLLQHHSLTELFDLSAEVIVKIDGFAEVSAEAIVEGLKKVREEFFKVYELGFNLSVTPKQSGLKSVDSPLAGKLVVFTGSMTQGSRGDMEKHAKALGAKVAKSVTGKTTYLVTGEKVGEIKINAAKDKGVSVLSEQEYLDLLANV